MKTEKHPVKTFANFAAVIIILSVIGNFAFDNRITQTMVKDIINDQTNEIGTIDINFTGISLSLIPLGIELYGLEILEKETGNSVISTTLTKTNVSIQDLFIGKLKLDRILFENSILDVGLALKISKSMELTSPPKQKKFDLVPREANILFNSVEFNNLSLSNYQTTMNSEDWNTRIGQIHLDIQLKDLKNFEGHVEINDISLQNSEFSIVENAQVTTNFALEGLVATLSETRLKSKRLEYEGPTTINLTKEYTFGGAKVRGNISGDLNMLGSWLDFEDTRGHVESTIDADIFATPNGSIESFKLKGKARTESGILYGYKLFDSQFEYKVDTDRISFSRLNLIQGGEELASISGWYSFDKAGLYSFDILPKKLSLSKILEIVSVDFDTVDGLLTQGTLTLSGASEPFNMDVAGKTNLMSMTLASTKDSKLTTLDSYPDCDLNLKIAIDAQQANYDGTQAWCDSPNKKTNETQNKAVNQDSSIKMTIGGMTDFDNSMAMIVKLTGQGMSRFSKFLGVDLNGKGTITTEIRGDYDKLGLNFRASLQEFFIHGVPLGVTTVSAKYDVEKSTLLAKEANFVLERPNFIDLQGTTVDFDNMNSNVKLSMRSVQNNQFSKLMSQIYPSKDIDIESIDKASFEGQISLNSIEKSIVDGTIVGKGFSFEGERYLKYFDTKFTVNPQKFDVSSLNVDPTGQMPISGSFTVWNENLIKKISTLFTEKNTFNFNFKSRNSARKNPLSSENAGQSHTDTSALSELPIIGPKLKELNIRGQISIEGELSGNIGAPSGVIKTQSNQLYVFGNRTSPINSTILVENKHLTIKFGQVGSTLIGSFTTDLGQDVMPYDANIFLDNFDLRFLLPDIISSDVRNYMYAKGSLSMTGNLEDIWQSTGKLNLKKVEFQYNHPSGIRDHRIKGTLENEFTLSLDNRRLFSENNKPLRITHNFGSIAVTPGKSVLPNKMDVSFLGEIDVDFLKEYFNTIEESSGKFQLKGRLANKISSPKIEASLTAINDEKGMLPIIGVASVRPSFRNITLDLAYKDNVIEVDKVYAAKGNGNISASGSLSFSPNIDSNLEIFLDGANFNYNLPIVKNTEAVINAKLKLSGSSFPFKLTGIIDVEKATANKSIDIRNEILDSVTNKKIADESIKQNEYLVFDIDLVSNDTIFIENKSMNLNLGHNIKLRGTNSDANLKGNLEVSSGKFTYKKDYAITRGLISFDDPQKNDPTLDISGYTELSGYKITVDISGHASDPQVEFSVDPPTREDGSTLSQLDILILMATGSLPTRDLNADAKDTFKYEAINIFMGNFDEPIERIINFTGQKLINQLYFDTYPSSIDGKLLIRANAPVNTGNKLDLVIQGDQEKVGLKAEYDLVETISTSVNYSKILNEDDNIPESSSEDIDASVDLRFRFLFP